MRYTKINRGKENRYWQRVSEHHQALSKFQTFIEKLLWKFKKKAYCPKCQDLTKFDVRFKEYKEWQKGEVKIIVGVIHHCTKCELEIHKGLDKVAEQYVGGMYEKL